MTLKPDVLSSKCSDIHHTEEISLSRLDINGDILCVIEKHCLWDGFSTSRIGFVDEGRNDVLHLFIVPVGDRQDDLFVSLILVWRFRVMDNEGCSKTIWVLSLVVRMVPVGPRLSNLVSGKFQHPNS